MLLKQDTAEAAAVDEAAGVGRDERCCWSEAACYHQGKSSTWTETESPLIHSCVHGARKQVTKSSERVRLEKHDLMGHLSEGP